MGLAVFDGVKLRWSLHRPTRGQIQKCDPKALPHTMPAGDLLVLVCRALAALGSWCMPLRAYPAPFGFLRNPAPPEQLTIVTPLIRDALVLVGITPCAGMPEFCSNPATSAPRVIIYADSCTVGNWPNKAGGWGFIIVTYTPPRSAHRFLYTCIVAVGVARRRH